METMSQETVPPFPLPAPPPPPLSHPPTVNDDDHGHDSGHDNHDHPDPATLRHVEQQPPQQAQAQAQTQTQQVAPTRFKSNSISQHQQHQQQQQQNQSTRPQHQQQQQPSPANFRKHAKRLTLQFPIVISDTIHNPPREKDHQTHLENRNAAMFFHTSKPDPALDYTLTNPEKAFDAADRLTGAGAGADGHGYGHGEQGKVDDDGTAFLTALAAQERKVLELREELQKAEAELTLLKKQWAISERVKKTSEIRFQTEALKSMRRPSTAAAAAATAFGVDAAGGRRLVDDAHQHPQQFSLDALREQTRLRSSSTNSNTSGGAREIDRRRGSYTARRHSPSLSLVSNTSGATAATAATASPRASKPRTVFQGSRHTRTLSLLANNPTVSFPQPHDIRNTHKTFPAGGSSAGGGCAGDAGGNVRSFPSSSFSSGNKASRSVTMPVLDVTKQSALGSSSSQQHGSGQESATLRRALAHNPTAEAFMRTGQQMAADFRDNLWTFLEDIRQAAVGEELLARGGGGSRSASGQQQGQQNNQQQQQQRQRKQHNSSGVPAVKSNHRYRHSANRSVSGPPSSISSSAGANAGRRSTSSRDGNDDAAFWKEFGLEVEAPASSSSSSSARSGNRSNARAAKTEQQQQQQRKSAQEKRPQQQPKQPQEQEVDLLDFADDNWDMWDNPPDNMMIMMNTESSSSAGRPGKPISHTPCSSTSTWPSSKPSQSPTSTAASSPPMSASASFADFHHPTAVINTTDGDTKNSSINNGNRNSRNIKNTRNGNASHEEHNDPSLSLTLLPPSLASSSSSPPHSPSLSSHLHHHHHPPFPSSDHQHHAKDSRQNKSNHGKSDSIPWPALKDLAPSKLTKTASTLMAEWERSLSSSPASPERVTSPKGDKFD